MTEQGIDKASAFEAARARLVALAYRMLGSRAEAEDVVQDVWLKWHLADTREVRTPVAWLTTITARLAIDRLRHRRVRQRVEQAETPEAWTSTRSDGEDPVKLLVARELTERLMSYLQELPPKCLAVFRLHRLEGLPQQEVAARLGFSERMVRRYVTYAMVYCRLRLDGVAARDAQEKVVL